jgi:guanylate kinase
VEEREKRIQNGSEELRDALNYVYIVVNNKVEDAVEDIRAIVRANKISVNRNRDKIVKLMKEYDL